MSDKVTATSTSTTEKRDVTAAGDPIDNSEDTTGTTSMTIEVRNDIPDVTRDALIAQLGPRSAPVVGNLADLQRAGAEAAAGGGTKSFDKGVAKPVDTSDEDFQRGAERTLREEAEAKATITEDVTGTSTNTTGRKTKG